MEKPFFPPSGKNLPTLLLTNLEWPTDQCDICWVVVHILTVAVETRLFLKSFPAYFLDIN